MGTMADAWRDNMSFEKGVEMFNLVAIIQMNYIVRLNHTQWCLVNNSFPINA